MAVKRWHQCLSQKLKLILKLKQELRENDWDRETDKQLGDCDRHWGWDRDFHWDRSCHWSQAQEHPDVEVFSVSIYWTSIINWQRLILQCGMWKDGLYQVLSSYTIPILYWMINRQNFIKCYTYTIINKNTQLKG